MKTASLFAGTPLDIIQNFQATTYKAPFNVSSSPGKLVRLRGYANQNQRGRWLEAMRDTREAWKDMREERSETRDDHGTKPRPRREDGNHALDGRGDESDHDMHHPQPPPRLC